MDMEFEVSKGALCSRYPFYETEAFILIAVCGTSSTSGSDATWSVHSTHRIRQFYTFGEFVHRVYMLDIYPFFSLNIESNSAIHHQDAREFQMHFLFLVQRCSWRFVTPNMFPSSINIFARSSPFQLPVAIY